MSVYSPSPSSSSHHSNQKDHHTDVPLVEIHNLKHSWGENFTLSIPYWSVQRGARVALIGPSGSGKTTLLMILAGVITPQEGEIWVLGTPLHRLNDLERRAWRATHLGLVTQNFALLDHLSVIENVNLPAQLNLVGETQVRVEAERWLRDLGLTETLHRSPSQLSQGERQRVALSRALVTSPRLLLADEPTAHLDPTTTHNVISILHRVVQGEEHSQVGEEHSQVGEEQHSLSEGLIVITHDLSLIDEFTHTLSVDAWSTSNRGEGKSTNKKEEKENENKEKSVLTSPLIKPRLRWDTFAKLSISALRFYWIRALLLVLTFSLTAALPLGVSKLTRGYERSLRSRAIATPLIIGSSGSRYDLVLSSLYFTGATLKDLPWRAVRTIQDENLGVAIPLHLKWTARQHPLVGTTPEYYDLRHLELERGHLPYFMGEVVLGAHTARVLNLAIGDQLLSDQLDLYDLAATYPMKLKVVGILKPTQTPDDQACFTDIKTAWIIEGIGHGHQALKDKNKDKDKDSIPKKSTQPKTQEVIQLGAGLVTDQVINTDTQGGFHFHGDRDQFPLSAILFYPLDQRSASMIKARSQRRTEWQVQSPPTVIEEVLSFIFKIESLFDILGRALFMLTLALGGLVIWLSAQMRVSEWETLALIGLSRWGSRFLVLFEVGFLLLGAMILCGVSLWLIQWLGGDLMIWLK